MQILKLACVMLYKDIRVSCIFKLINNKSLFLGWWLNFDTKFRQRVTDNSSVKCVSVLLVELCQFHSATVISVVWITWILSVAVDATALWTHSLHVDGTHRLELDCCNAGLLVYDSGATTDVVHKLLVFLVIIVTRRLFILKQLLTLDLSACMLNWMMSLLELLRVSFMLQLPDQLFDRLHLWLHQHFLLVDGTETPLSVIVVQLLSTFFHLIQSLIIFS